MNNSDISTSALMIAARRNGQRRIQSGQIGMGDYTEPFIEGIRPATSAPHPMGPADFPVQQGPLTPPTTTDGWLSRACSLLQRILDELIRQNTASRPVIRAVAVTAVGQTLDWTPVGVMDRLMIRNKGTNSLWYSYDKNGPAVNAFTSDESFELQANESVNLTHCIFQKIGVKCAGGQTATVHAQAFQSVAGNQAGTII